MQPLNGYRLKQVKLIVAPEVGLLVIRADRASLGVFLSTLWVVIS